MKRYFLTVTLLVIICLAGCADARTSGDKVTLTYWSESIIGGTRFAEELFRQTNVQIEYMQALAYTRLEQLNILKATGTYPDIVEYGWLNYSGGPEQAIADGYILNLTNIIREHSPNLLKFLEENPQINYMVTTESMDYYAYPFIRKEESLQSYIGPMIRKDLLDQLGLDVPQTIEEWDKVLYALKNEAAIPYPLTFNDSVRSAGAFMGAFGTSEGFFIQDGKVKFGMAEPGYQEFLKLFRRWYQLGYIDPYFSVAELGAILANMQQSYSAVTVGAVGGIMGRLIDDVRLSLVAAPYPTLQKGEKPMFGHKVNPYQGDGSASISPTCKNIEAAAKFLDYGYSEEGILLYNFGVNGESYEIKDGKPVYTDLILHNPDGLSMADALKKYVRANSSGGPFIQSPYYFEQYCQLPEQKEAVVIWSNTDAARYKMPMMQMNISDSTATSKIRQEVVRYANDMMVSFINGTVDLSYFDTYIATLEELGMKEVINIYQKVYDNYRENYE